MANETAPEKAGTTSGALSTFATANPFKAFREEIDRMFHAFSAPQMLWNGDLEASNDALGLRVDISETDDQIQVKADLPGVSEEDVEIALDGDILRVCAEKKSDEEKTDKNWRVVERSYGMFERSIRVPAGINPDKIEAALDNGVLTVTLPKPPEAKSSARRIAVKTAA